MLFPTIRFAMFFAVVMPASWLLTPLPRRRHVAARLGGDLSDEDHGQRWAIPAGLIAAAALLGPLAPSGGWPTSLKVVLWLAALGLFGLGLVRWFDLTRTSSSRSATRANTSRNT